MVKPSAITIAPDIAAPVEPVSSLDPSTAPVEGSNLPVEEPVTYETYREKARYYGGLKSAGDDSLAMLAIDMCDGGKRGLIDPRSETDRKSAKLADLTDQVEEIFTDYVTSRGLKAVHERKDVANKAGQLRNFVRLGMLKNVDGPALLDEVKSAYRATLEPVTDKKLRAKFNDGFTTYLEVCKAQIDPDQVKIGVLTPDQIAKHFYRKGPKVKVSVARQWSKIAKMAKALTDGTLKDTDGNVVEDKSTDGANLAAEIVAYATDLEQIAKAQELQEQADAIRFEREQRAAAREAAE